MVSVDVAFMLSVDVSGGMTHRTLGIHHLTERVSTVDIRYENKAVTIFPLL
jgi:hypothetical protein